MVTTALLVAFAIAVIAVWGASARRSWSLGIASCAVFLGIAAFLAVLVLPGGTGTKAKKRLGESGEELHVVQRANYSAEPYTTALLYKDAEGKWWKAQLDFQDVRWIGSCRVVDTLSKLEIYRNGDLYASVNVDELEVELASGRSAGFELMTPERFFGN